MKKRSIFTPIVLLSVLLTACGQSGAEENSAPAEPETQAETQAQAETSPAEAETQPETEASVTTGEPEKTKLEVGHLNSTAHLLAFVAKEENLFADEGLDVTLTQLANGTELASGLESGKLDAALIGSVPSITMQAADHDLTIFGGAMTNGHGYVIKSEYTEGLDSWDYTILQGKNVAVAKNTMDDLELRLLLRDAGIEIGEGEDQVNLVYFDSQSNAYAALSNEEIDACSVYSPYASLAKSQGYEVVYYDVNFEQFENQPCCRQVATDTQIAESPNTYIAFERAMIRAYQFTQENHDKTIEDVAKYIDIDPELIEVEVYGGFSSSHPDPDKQATVRLKEDIVSLGLIEDYDIEPHYNTEIYQTALSQVVERYPDEPVYQEMQKHFDEFE
ncbi:MAG: ABC transporter substrate-binding protein [Oscillospiraceae bacterium]|nr:ABC transporter substrate-binding protein [Oscillospiraceae bacterium]